MTTVRLVLAFVRRNPLSWAFHVLTLALGIGLTTAIILLGNALDDRFKRDIAGIDLVVGAKGSPLQLITSAIFQADIPTGNIPLDVAERIAKNRMVAASAMILLGDNVKGLRIVGTTDGYPELYGASLARGAWYAGPMEVVLGSAAADILNIDVGGTFVGQHGLTGGGEMHSEFPYRVTGVLNETGTVIDRLVLTVPESVWRIHEHEAKEEAAEKGEAAATEHPREVTALLIKYRSAMGAVTLPKLVSAMPDIQAAAPPVEAARLRSLLGTGADLMTWLAIALLAVSAIGFVISLFAAVQHRRRELALLRTIGTTPGRLLGIVFLEASMLGLLGGVAGLALGRLLASAGAAAAGEHGGPVFAIAPFGPVDLAVIAAALLLSLIAATGPALSAYRTDPAQILKAAA